MCMAKDIRSVKGGTFTIFHIIYSLLISKVMPKKPTLNTENKINVQKSLCFFLLQVQNQLASGQKLLFGL